MATFTATVERAADGTWTAAVFGEHTVLGTGETRDEALRSVREGLAGTIAYLREQGEALSPPIIEVVSIEVAA